MNSSMAFMPEPPLLSGESFVNDEDDALLYVDSRRRSKLRCKAPLVLQSKSCKPFARANSRSSNRLRWARVESDLAGRRLILTGQQVSSAPFDREFRQIKLIGEVYDKCHETLEQLVIFLATYMKKDDEKED